MPHYQPEGAAYFLTWRLHGSLPAEVSAKILKSDPRPGHRFRVEDGVLDRAATGPRWLGDTNIAEFVAYTIKAGDSERGFYELHAWVVMPNHVHILLTPNVQLSSITRWIKGSTARFANLALGLTGQRFWQEETFDRWVRDRQEFHRIVRYIEENPVRAGLASVSEQWPWSSRTGGTACPTA